MVEDDYNNALIFFFALYRTGKKKMKIKTRVTSMYFTFDIFRQYLEVWNKYLNSRKKSEIYHRNEGN